MRRWTRTAAAAAAAVLLAGAAAGCRGTADDSGSAADAPHRPAAPSKAAPTPSPSPSVDQDPASYAKPVARYAREAGVNPQLLMAILYNESYKPHGPEVERQWQKLKPGASFGIANMHEATFDETRANHPSQLGGSTWQQLPDHTSLAVRSAAWYLHDLSRQLPSSVSGTYTRDELLALGYNAGPGNMLAFARGVKAGPQASQYAATLRDNWPKAKDALAENG